MPSRVIKRVKSKVSKVKPITTISKTYRLMGIDTAMQLLRPGAKWEISGTMFTRWEDPRPCPSINEVHETILKIKDFEDSINTILLPEQKTEVDAYYKKVDDAVNASNNDH